MDDQEIQIIANSLENAVEQTPQLRLSQDEQVSILLLNRDGCLALSAELLRLVTETSPNIPRFLTRVEQIQVDEDDSETCVLRLTENVELPPDMDQLAEESKWYGSLFMLGCAVVGFTTIFLILSGVYFWIGVLSSGS